MMVSGDSAVANAMDDVQAFKNVRLGFDDYLEAKLAKSGKDALLEEIRRISSSADISFAVQHEQNGLGGAILCAESFVGDEPFAVLYGDDVIIGEDPAIGQLARAYEKYGKSVVGINRVPSEDICKYNSMKLEDNDFVALLENNFGREYVKKNVTLENYVSAVPNVIINTPKPWGK